VTNLELDRRIGTLAKQEREALSQIVALIAEALTRKTRLDFGFADCYAWLTKGHGCSNGAAHRRICAAKLMQAVPAVEEKIASGALQISNLAIAHSAIRKEEQRTGSKVELEEKGELIASLESKTAPQAQIETAKAFPQLEPPKVDALKATHDGWTLTVTLTHGEKALLDRARELLSHTEPWASWAKIIARLALEEVKRRDPVEKQKRGDARGVTATGSLRTAVFARANGQCEHVHHETGRRCESRMRLEIDHVQPKAFGGGDEFENLRGLCRNHNAWAAERALGRSKANAWRRASPDSPLAFSTARC